MHFRLAFAAIALCAAAPAPAQRADPCRRPHCTFAGEDLPLVLALADLDPFTDRLRVAPGVELDPTDAAHYLWDRHRQGHGGWPGYTSSKTLAEKGLGSCDPSAVDALYAVTLGTLRRNWCALESSRVADVLERNGRFADAERLILAVIPADSKPEDGLAWDDYTEFLMRRGRFEEALPLIERKTPFNGDCGLSRTEIALHQFSKIERCCDGIYGGTCDGELFDKRLEIVGLRGLANYIAQRSFDRGSAQPERDAMNWFETTIPLKLTSEQSLPDKRQYFVAELTEWSAARTAPRSPDEFDWAKPAEAERGVTRARELARAEPESIHPIVYSAVESGSPAAGNALQELLADPSIHWSIADRGHLLALWRDAILTRTFGCADPENPATW